MKHEKNVLEILKDMINYNMRCIETYKVFYILCLIQLINYNMRCIETVNFPVAFVAAVAINYNMRCIETGEYNALIKFLEG